MKEKILLILCLLLFSSFCFAGAGIVCNNKDTLDIMVSTSGFEETGEFEIVIRNLSGDTINVQSLLSEGQLNIETFSSGLIEDGGGYSNFRNIPIWHQCSGDNEFDVC